MTKKIEPALTADQWDDVRERHTPQFMVTPGVFVSMDDLRVAPAACVAIANFFLPDRDPRKITIEWVRELRKTADSFDESERRGEKEGAYVETWLFRQIADALESYLPPE